MSEGCGRKIGSFDCCTVVIGDCVETMEQLPNGCANLLFADPPYNKGKAEWDKGHDWRTWIPEAVRVLKDNGAFWVIHRNAKELGKISDFIEEQGGPPFVNWITWDLFNGHETQQALGGPLIGATMASSLRSFQQMAEYLIYHADLTLIARNLLELRKAAGLTCDYIEKQMGYIDNRGRGSRLFYRWETGDSIPTEKDYIQARLICEGKRTSQLDLRFPIMRRMAADYKTFVPTFNNPGGISSVWQGPIAKRNGHPTPKPGWLLERIIKTTSNPGDLVVDFFMGSGTTAVEAQKSGRHFFGCDIKAEYMEMAKKELSTVQLGMPL